MKSLLRHAALATATLATSALADPEHDLLRERIKKQEETIKQLKEQIFQLSSDKTVVAPSNHASETSEDIPNPSIEIPAPSIITGSEDSSKDVEVSDSKTNIARAIVVESAPSYHTVQSGDHLTKIARKHDTNIQTLLSLNPEINPNALRIGQRVNVPSLAAVEKLKANNSSETDKTPLPVKPEISAIRETSSGRMPYIVQQGDTMFNLSRKHKTTVAKIQALNPGLDPLKMWAGKSMYLPAPKNAKSSAPQTAQVRSNPTPPSKLEPVIRKESVTVPIPEPMVKAKQTTATANSAPQTETASNDSAISGKITTVTVKEQMTFGDFAVKHRSTVDRINVLNGLTLNSSTVLAEGSELYVPRK